MLVAVSVLFFLAPTEDVGAISTFSRKYHVGCATCHDPYPRLNAIGEAFRLNGYRFVENEFYVRDKPIKTGDEADKKLWPKAVWPADIPGLLPISVRALSDYNIDIGGTRASRSTFDFPNEVDVLAAGTLGGRISFFTEVEWKEEDLVPEARLQFHDLFGIENAFNVRVGTLLGDYERRLAKNHHLLGMWRMPYPRGFGKRNTFRLHMKQPGVELFGFGSWWRYGLGIVEGDRSISDKDFYGELAVKMGGLGFDGSRERNGKLLSCDECCDGLIFSLLAYRGSARVNHFTGTDAGERKDRFWRVGPRVRWMYKNLTIGGGYMYGLNERPYGALASESVTSHAWFVTAEYAFYSWLIPSVRYEELRLDNIEAPGLQKDHDRARIVASLRAQLRANVSLTVEGRFYTKDQRFTHATPRGETDDDNQVCVRLDFAF